MCNIKKTQNKERYLFDKLWQFDFYKMQKN